MKLKLLFIASIVTALVGGVVLSFASPKASAAVDISGLNVNLIRCRNGQGRTGPAADRTYYTNNKNKCDVAIAVTDGVILTTAFDVDVLRCKYGRDRNRPDPATDQVRLADRTYYTNHKINCDKALLYFPNVGLTPSPTASQTVSPTPSTLPSGVSPAPSPNPSASTTFIPTGGVKRLRQTKWATADPAAAPANLSTLNTVTNNKLCGLDYSDVVGSNKFVKQSNVKVSADSENLIGKKNTVLADTYLISQPFTENSVSAVNWKEFYLVFDRNQTGTIAVFYRLSNTAGTADPNDTGWIPMADPASVGEVCGANRVARYNINQSAKIFQYKVGLISKGTNDQQIHRIDLSYQLGTVVLPSPTPTPTATSSQTPSPGSSFSPTPSGSVSPTSGTGRLTIKTRKLDSVPKSSGTSPSATPTSGTVNPLCYDGLSTSVVPSIGFNGEQISGGSTTVQDQSTDESGIWKGLDGNVDQFPSGTYRFTFNSFQESDYRLADFCVTPNDGSAILQTQTDPLTRKVTLVIKPGTETTVTVLYAPRTKPYIQLEKVAAEFTPSGANGTRRVISGNTPVHPGQTFVYVITYTNTSDGTAKDVLIQDVLTHELQIPAAEIDKLTAQAGVAVEPQADGNTLVKLAIPELAKGATGSLIIPVMALADAFTK